MSVWVQNGAPAGWIAGRLEKWLLAADGQAFCARFERANRAWWRLPITLSWHAASGLYGVHDRPGRQSAPARPDSIMIARRERVFRYRRGVADRIHRLARKYFLDRVPFEDGDVVIDCGANVGEVGLYVQSRADIRLIAVEPSDREAGACNANVFDGRPETHRAALWHTPGEHPFYDSNATGDSSLIPPATPHVTVSTVPTTTLQQLVDAQRIEHIKLLKIEAEGAEPEILAGGANILARVAFCTVDCGPERGASAAHVIPAVCNTLIGAGFELLDVNLERHICLFRNPANT